MVQKGESVVVEPRWPTKGMVLERQRQLTRGGMSWNTQGPPRWYHLLACPHSTTNRARSSTVTRTTRASQDMTQGSLLSSCPGWPWTCSFALVFPNSQDHRPGLMAFLPSDPEVLSGCILGCACWKFCCGCWDCSRNLALLLGKLPKGQS